MSIEALFVALADGTRRAVFESLARQPAAVNELAAQLPVTRAAVSQHLKVLLEAGLVDVEVRGRQRIYRLRPQALEQLAAYARSPSQAAPTANDQATAGADADGAAQDPFEAGLAKWRAQAPHIDNGVLALLMYFAQIGQYVMRSNEEVAAVAGLNFSDVTLLGALRRQGPPYESTPTQLSHTFWITLPGMTKRLARLEGMGMLARVPAPNDGRSVLLRLTERGLSTLQDLIAQHQPPEYYALLTLPEPERRRLSRLLRELLEEIDRLHGRQRPPYFIR